MFRRLLPLVVVFTLISSSMALPGARAFAGVVHLAKAAAGARTPTTDYVINSLDDTTDGTCDLNHCSLREAITLANANAGADTITFSVSGTIALTNTLPPVSDTLTIDGGQVITVSGANAHQVMHVNSGAALTLNALTIANGSSYTGGGLDNEGALTVTNSTFTGNYALQGGGIYNHGTLTVMNSTFASNISEVSVSGEARGGGIDNTGALTVTNSTFADNRATFWFSLYCCPVGQSYGGGISNQGALAVINSTFSGNRTVRACTPESGDGAPHTDNPIPIPCTCFDNSCPGQGGGIANAGAAIVRNTIVANSQGGNCDGAVTDGGNNLDSGTSCNWGAGDGSRSNTDPQLAGLADNGGATPTLRLWPDSPAIDGVTFNAPNACPATDQRGVARPIGPRCDIGAYESNMITRIFQPLVVKNFVDAPDLIVNNLIASTHAVTVVIQNSGPAPVMNEFWVDLYVDPQPAPTGVNQVWNDGRSTQGVVWGITASALPIQPGDLLTLTLSSPYYRADLSHLVNIASNAAVYAQVDSADIATSYGAVLETHETLNGPYNNILGPVLPGPGLADQTPALPIDGQRSKTGQLPRRPG